MKFNFLAAIAVVIFTMTAGFQTANAQKAASAKDVSLIAFLVKDSKLSAEDLKTLPFMSISIGKNKYLISSKSGKVISQSKADEGSGGYYAAYAEVFVSLLDANKNDSGAGAGQLLKSTGGKWKKIATNETDYQCADVKSVPKAALKALKVECN